MKIVGGAEKIHNSKINKIQDWNLRYTVMEVCQDTNLLVTSSSIAILSDFHE